MAFGVVAVISLALSFLSWRRLNQFALGGTTMFNVIFCKE